MSFYLRAKKLDFSSGGRPWVVVLQEKEAKTFGIVMGDRVEVCWEKNKAVVVAYYTNKKVNKGEIGIFREIWKYRKVKDSEPISIRVLSRPPSIK